MQTQEIVNLCNSANGWTWISLTVFCSIEINRTWGPQTLSTSGRSIPRNWDEQLEKPDNGADLLHK